jgi:hypothetical protein
VKGWVIDPFYKWNEILFLSEVSHVDSLPEERQVHLYLSEESQCDSLHKKSWIIESFLCFPSDESQCDSLSVKMWVIDSFHKWIEIPFPMEVSHSDSLYVEKQVIVAF